MQVGDMIADICKDLNDTLLEQKITEYVIILIAIKKKPEDSSAYALAKKYETLIRRCESAGYEIDAEEIIEAAKEIAREWKEKEE